MIYYCNPLHIAKGQVRVTDLLRYIEGKEVGGAGVTYPAGEKAVVAAPREYSFSGASRLYSLFLLLAFAQCEFDCVCALQRTRRRVLWRGRCATTAEFCPRGGWT